MKHGAKGLAEKLVLGPGLNADKEFAFLIALGKALHDKRPATKNEQ